MMISHTLRSKPAIEPVTLTEMKAHARVDHTDDDALLTFLIGAARQWCEHYARRAFIHQTWELALSALPSKRFITLPRAPLASITQVQVFDEEDEATVWDSANYYADTVREPGRLVLREGASWPDWTRCANGMAISYVCGYGAQAQDVPEDLRLAIMQLALHWYEYRGEAVQTTGLSHAPMAIEAILHPYRLYAVGGAWS